MFTDFVLGLVLLVLVLYAISMLKILQGDRREASNAYYNKLTAYRIGFIEKAAKENDIELTYTGSGSELINNIETEVKEDMNSIKE